MLICLYIYIHIHICISSVCVCACNYLSWIFFVPRDAGNSASRNKCVLLDQANGTSALTIFQELQVVLSWECQNVCHAWLSCERSHLGAWRQIHWPMYVWYIPANIPQIIGTIVCICNHMRIWFWACTNICIYIYIYICRHLQPHSCLVFTLLLCSSGV